MTMSSWLIWASCDARNSAFVCTLACGNGSIAALTAASPLGGGHPLGELGDDEEVAGGRVGHRTRGVELISQLPTSSSP